jgi:hypothetical protein
MQKICSWFIPLLFALMVSCGEKMVLPTPSTQTSNFVAGETTLVRLNPAWAGFPNPTDVTVGPDGIIFVADSSNPYLTTLDASGSILHHDNLDRIGPVISPCGIGIDPRLNVFIVNGSDTVYRWNQYINMIGVSSVAQAFVLLDTLTGDTLWVDFPTANQTVFNDSLPNDHWVLIDIIWTSEQAIIDSLMGVTPFYVADLASFQGVAASTSDPEIYVSDSGRDRIWRVGLVWDKLLRLENGAFGFSFTSSDNGLAAMHGTGAGTADHPQGISMDDQNRILFTQTEGNFLVQRLQKVEEANTFTVGFGFTSDVMELGRFSAPQDVVAAPLTDTDLGWIYVADTDANRIQVFDRDGVFKRNAAVTAIPTPTHWTDTLVVFPDSLPPETTFVYRDTVIIVESADIIDHPSGLAYHNGVLYICDQGNARIERYRLSFSKEDLPDE